MDGHVRHSHGNKVRMTQEDKRMTKTSNFQSPIFLCTDCDYITCRRWNFDQHLASAKHVRMTKEDSRGQNVPSQISTSTGFVCDCGRSYKHRQGLWKHRRACPPKFGGQSSKFGEFSPNFGDVVATSSVEVTDKDLIVMLIQDNNELRKLMIESNNKLMDLCKNHSGGTHITHTNSHNKAFNLNFFLNETCKNAMNIDEFAESIHLQLSDLERIGEVGYVEGISNIIVQNLKALDVTVRPIHCTDKKRETFYVKDENKWEKEDEDKKKIKKVIDQVAFKNQRLLPKFKEEHPGCNYSESTFADQYSKIVIEAMGGVGNNDAEKTDKIVRNIAKEVVINKSSSSSYSL